MKDFLDNNENRRSKVNDFKHQIQESDVKKYPKLLKLGFDSIISGRKEALKDIKNNPLLYRQKLSQSSLINRCIIKDFIIGLGANHNSVKLREYSSHSMTYFLVDERFLLCFKAFDENFFIKNMKTNRVKQVLQGETLLNKDVKKKLDKLGIKNPPVVFIGWISDKYNELSQVNLINYFSDKINFNLNLNEFFNVDSSEDLNVNPKRKDDNDSKDYLNSFAI